ncbi:type IX secretion system protein PorQ [Porphyromonas sp. COT-290 OH860]|uniref:type IX secretion system protein PorQ n=1 Tax=Porphyromonas sp. COT-290 OH860 TaxID=1515615 RepID=UPI000693816E|nr:type IX secretion system protein PorQ [Porphyromonas sp. COT-290 OH860]
MKNQLRQGVYRSYLLPILALCVLLPLELMGQSRGATLHYISLPATTKTMALGGVTTTIVANDVALALESPALFGLEQNGQLSLSYMNYLGNANLGTAFYGRALGERGAWGVGARFIDYGSQEERSLQGVYLGTFRPRDVMLQTSYSYELTEHLRAGISLKGTYSSILEYTAWGLGADLGLNYFSENKERSVGIALVNVGTQFRPLGLGSQEAMPWDIRVGYSQKFAHAPFQVHLTAYSLRPKHTGEFTPTLGRTGRILRHLALGVEYIPSNHFWLALGYNPRIAQDYRELRGAKLSGLSAGVGINRAGYRVAVSAVAYDSSFWGFMATFSTDFGLVDRL